jgi:hypothetical protein
MHNDCKQGEDAVNEIRFRKMEMDVPVTITLPAHVLLGFLYTYTGAEWNDTCATQIALEIRNTLLDPVYLKEEEAKVQEHADMHQAVFNHFTGQGPIEMPPNVTDFQGGLPDGLYDDPEDG